MISKIRIDSSLNGGYDIYFARDFERISERISYYSHPIFFVDASLQAHFSDWLNALSAISHIHIIRVSETFKSLAGVEEIIKYLSAAGCGRHSTVVVVGGGVLQDTVSFAAHIYHRGLDTVLVPTTLLAMCDSSVGGKCAVNFEGHKNQLGAFHPPQEVIICDCFLQTLPDQALYSGAGELLKYALMSGAQDFERFKCNVRDGGIRAVSRNEWIHQGLLIKKNFVEQDEFDRGVRRHLNYGHTFGHAIEQATENRVPHGLAVAYGIDIANSIACSRGLLSKELAQDIHVFIKAAFPFDVFAGLMAKNLIESAQKDKKTWPDGIDMVLLLEPGILHIERLRLDEQIAAVLKIYLNEYAV